MTQPRKIRWLIAHQPQELFVRTARAFSEELNKRCANELEIEILTYPEYQAKYHDIVGLEHMVQKPDTLEDHEEKGMKAFWNALFDSEVEMSQIQVVRVGMLHKDFQALDLPFLFEDHDHVQRVVEGPIGQELCASLGKTSGVTGLGFTYSGGYRVVGSHDPITKLDDLRTKTIAVQQPLSLGVTIESMGGNYEWSAPNLWHKYDPMGPSGKCDAVETTYLRFNEINGKHILKTDHSMFMTSIVVSNKFWNSLTAEQQDIFRECAVAASRKERQWSIEDAEKFEREAQARGITITPMSDEDRAELKKKSQLAYVKSKHFFSKDLVKNIRLH
jgi:TRAP-type C4-dicarboxylate transport system substrate-binding protein